MTQVRLVFFLPSLSAYRDRVNLVASIARMVDRAVLVTPRLDADPAPLGASDLRIVVVDREPRFPGSTGLSASRVVGRLLEQEGFNVVHDTFGMLLPLFLQRRKYPGRLFVTSFFHLAEWEFRRWVWPKYGPLFLRYSDLRTAIPRILVQRLMCQLSDCVVLQAPGLVDRLTKYVRIPASKVRWIPNNVRILNSRRDFESRANRARIELLVASLSRAKGADRLLDLLGVAKAVGVDVHTNVLGDLTGIDAPYLSKRIRKENLGSHLTFHNRVAPDEIVDFYGNADWLFHLTSVDASPRVVFEALANGLPVIASRHPGITILDPDGRFILFAEPFFAESLLKTLATERPRTDAYESRVTLGYSRVCGDFSTEAVSVRYVDLYRRLLADRSA